MTSRLSEFLPLLERSVLLGGSVALSYLQQKGTCVKVNAVQNKLGEPNRNESLAVDARQVRLILGEKSATVDCFRSTPLELGSLAVLILNVI